MPTTPLALFITWTVYGTHLPGDDRGWRHRQSGQQLAQQRLETWHQDRLNHQIITLDDSMRTVADRAVREICELRSWKSWAIAVRSNHVHVVVTAPEYKPETVRDQIKAKATRELRQAFSVWQDRPVWTTKGDIEFLDTESEIEQCTIYVNEAQDRKDQENQ